MFTSSASDVAFIFAITRPPVYLHGDFTDPKIAAHLFVQMSSNDQRHDYVFTDYAMR